jgi:hypothetical protein
MRSAGEASGKPIADKNGGGYLGLLLSVKNMRNNPRRKDNFTSNDARGEERD